MGASGDHCTDCDPESTPYLSSEATKHPLDSLLATTSQTSPEEASAKTGQEKRGNDGVRLHRESQLCAQKAFPAGVGEDRVGTASKDRSPGAHGRHWMSNTELRFSRQVQNLSRTELGTQGTVRNLS